MGQIVLKSQIEVWLTSTPAREALLNPGTEVFLRVEMEEVSRRVINFGVACGTVKELKEGQLVWDDRLAMPSAIPLHTETTHEEPTDIKPSKLKKSRKKNFIPRLERFPRLADLHTYPTPESFSDLKKREAYRCNLDVLRLFAAGMSISELTHHWDVTSRRVHKLAARNEDLGVQGLFLFKRHHRTDLRSSSPTAQ